jgi:hypothetical protein
MAIPAPDTKIRVIASQGLIFPKMGLAPLEAALHNVNWLWLNHKPALVSLCPTEPSGMTRNVVIVVPIIPSADGIRYDFRTTVVTSGAATLTVVGDYCTAYTGLAASGTPTVWTNIFTQATAFVGAGRNTQDKTGQTIPATAIALRWTLSISAGTYETHHLLVTPGETAVGAGVKASGFVPWDSALFGTVAGAPVHTELLNRCRMSALSLMIDRKQAAFSFGQDEVQANTRISSQNKSTWQAFQPVRCYLPNQGKTATLRIRALISKSGATGSASVVRLSQLPGPGVTAPASLELVGSVAGAISTGDLTVTLCGNGLGRYVDLLLEHRTDGNFYTYLHSIVAIWSPEA